MLIKPCLWIAPVLFGISLQSTPLLLNAQRAVVGDIKVNSLRLEGTKSVAAVSPDRPAAPSAAIELLWLFPDHYRQLTESPSMMSYAGFVRQMPLNGGRALQPGGAFDPGQPGASFVPTQRTNAARLLLGIFGDAKGVLTVQTSTGESGAVKVTGPNGFECLVDVDPSTRVPLRVRYREMVGFMPASTPGQRSFRTDPPEPAEVTISFLDRRVVGGVRIPHHVMKVGHSLTGGRERIIEDLQFDRVVVNGPMTAADFEKVQ